MARSERVLSECGPVERAHFWHAPEFDHLELLNATYVTHAFSKHVHSGYAIGVIDRGAETFYYRGGNHVVSMGGIVVINPDELHTGSAVDEQGWTYRVIYPSVALMQQIASEITGKAGGVVSFPQPTIWDVDLAARLRRLCNALQNSDQHLERGTLLRSALGALIARHAADPIYVSSVRRQRPEIAKARAYIDAHYQQNITLDDLARLVYLSPFHLVRLFRLEVGLPPHLYLTQVRVERAKRLLAVGLPIATVAQEVGFAHQSHLTHQFKRIVGVPPGQYVANL